MTQSDVDLAKEIADDVQQTLECSDAYRNVVEKRITEALAGRWKDEDLVDFANMISMEGDGTKWEGQSMARLLARFKSERGIK